MGRRRIAIAAATASLLAAACQGGRTPADAGPDGGSGLPSPALAPTDACAQIAAAAAAVEVRCHRLDPSDEARYAASLCAGWIDLEQAAFDAGQFAYSVAAVACEVAFRQQQPCNASSSSLTGCEPLAWGTGLTGDNCGDDSACQFGDFCNRAVPGTTCGTCAADPGIGGACGPAASNAPCASGTCDGEACEPEVGLEQACYSIGGGGAVCQPGLACLNGNCQTPGTAGTLCGGDSDCLDGLYCDSNLSVCTARPALHAPCPAGVCTFGLACSGGVPDGGATDGGAEDGGADAGLPTCEPLNANGACTPVVSGYRACPEAEWCGPDGGCLPAPGLGDSCAGGAPCLVGACVQGSCQALPAGQPCTAAEQCLTRQCGGSGPTPVCAGLCD